jgi:hypothetical protein
MRISFVIFSLAFLALGCESSIVEDDIQPEEYPAFIPTITDHHREALISRYQYHNPGFCASINKYGLNESRTCLDREIVRVEIKDEDHPRLKDIAAEFLKKNEEYTNVNDPDQLQIRQTFLLTGCIQCDGSEGDSRPITLRIVYSNQSYNGLEVDRTTLTAFVDMEKVYRLDGHWHSEFVVPEIDSLDFNDVRNSLLGREFTYNDGFGNKSYTITEESFGELEQRMIFPHETDDGKELRVVLVVDAGIWNFYTDSTTGELLHKRQRLFF